jgi:acetyl-CoA C-acetyltransferase
MNDVVITGAARTAIGSFMGSLADVPAPKLGAVAIAEAVARSGIAKEDVDQVILGNVLSAGIGQAPARQAGILAGLPPAAGALTVNKMCGSGLKAVMLAAQSVATGEFEVVAAGGMESMSQAPYLLKKARAGYRLGNDAVFDHILLDGLVDPYKNLHMGSCAEMLNREHGIGREDQDAYAATSYARALAAVREGRFSREVASVSVPQRKGPPASFEVDEEPARGQVERLPALKPAFEDGGAITAGNASKLNDGAAAVVVMANDTAKAKRLLPLARIVGYATASFEPVWFTVAPAEAIRRVLARTGVGLNEVGLVEINEAFACVALEAIRSLGLDPERVNVNGGAVALGHPIGASGARILTTLLYALQDRKQRYGLAALCIGGGEAVAVLVERIG